MFTWIHLQWHVFLGLGLFLVFIPIIAVINVKWKLVPRKGFMQMTSTLGLRFFIGMMALIYINMISLLVIPSFPLVIPFTVSVVLLFAIMIWG
jgi:predicted small integral membrane protein